MFLVLWLTLGAGTLVSSTKSELCPDTAKLTCGITTYNPLSQICCDGVVNQLANMTHPDCCAQEAYDRSSHLCCRHNAEAQSTDVSRMVQAKCCGIEAFDITKQKCCLADVKDSMPIVYYPMSHSCKQAAKVDILNKTVNYDMRTDKCGCGVSYDPKSQMCCPGNVVVNVPANTTNPHCCGKIVYDQHTHKCCNGMINDIRGTVQPSCCGPSSTFYDQSTELCCDGEKRYFHGLTSPACCGKEAFDAKTHTCVKGRIIVKTASTTTSTTTTTTTTTTTPPIIKLIKIEVAPNDKKCPNNSIVVGFRSKPFNGYTDHICKSPSSGRVTTSNCAESAGVDTGTDICPTGKLPKWMCNKKFLSGAYCGLSKSDISVTCCNTFVDGRKVTATKTCKWVDGKVNYFMNCGFNMLAIGLRVTSAFYKEYGYDPPLGSIGIYCCNFDVAAT